MTKPWTLDLVVIGAITAVLGLLVAREYRRTDTVQTRPGLDLSDLEPIQMKQEPHAARVARLFTAISLLGVAAMLVGLIRSLT